MSSQMREVVDNWRIRRMSEVELKVKIEQLDRELERLGKTVEQLNNDILNERRVIAEYEHDILTFKSEIAQNNEEINKLSLSLSNLEAQRKFIALRRWGATVAHDKKGFAKNSQSLKEVLQKIDETTAQIQDYERKVSDNEKHMSIRQRLVQILTHEMNAHEATLADVQMRIIKLESQKTNIINRLSELSTSP